jgi:hypothetical protein
VNLETWSSGIPSLIAGLLTGSIVSPTFELTDPSTVERWPASAEWAAGLALTGQFATPLGLNLSGGLGLTEKRHTALLKYIVLCF